MNLLQRLGLIPPPVTVPYYGDWTTLTWEDKFLGATSVTPHPSVFTNYPLWGEDTSKWQGDPDYVKAKAEGIRFVLSKCSEGYGYYDPKFERSYNMCSELGLVFSAYHFVRPGVATQYQLDTIKKAVEGKRLHGFALDCEVSDGQDSAKITDVIWNLLIKCKPYVDAQKFYIYSRKSWWDYYVKRSTHWKEEADAWPAHWNIEQPSVMADWPSWTVWQAGIVNGRFGVPGALDFDVWNPAVPFPGAPLPPPDPEPDPEADYYDMTLKSKAGKSYAGRITEVK